MSSRTCNAIRGLLVDYSDGELSAPEADRVAAHLAECPACRAELRLLERSLDLARSVWRESAARAPGGRASAATGRRFPHVSATGEPCPTRRASRLATSSARRESGDKSPHSKGAPAWGLLACVAAVLLAVGAWLFWGAGPGDELPPTELAGPLERPVNWSVSPEKKSPAEAPDARGRQEETEEPAPAPRCEDADVETLIARVGRAARLGASAELLAAHPGLEPYRAQTDRYLAEVYRGTPAGDRAAGRVGPRANQGPAEE